MIIYTTDGVRIPLSIRLLSSVSSFHTPIIISTKQRSNIILTILIQNIPHEENNMLWGIYQS